VIPARNAERWLPDAVASVLGQTWRDLECIVVDDGSVDGSAAILDAVPDPRLRWMRREGPGSVAAARNAGIAAARAPFVAFLDADDVWLPRKLEVTMALFERQPGATLAFTGYVIADAELQELCLMRPPVRDPAFRRWLLLEGNGIAFASTAVVRRAALDGAEGFRGELSVSADVELAERLAADGCVGAIDEGLVLYRVHPQQLHRDLTQLEHDRSWILDERRGSGRYSATELRRGRANLHVRLFVYELQAGRLRVAGRHLASTLASSPLRLVALPVEAMRRRVARRVDRRRNDADRRRRQDEIAGLHTIIEGLRTAILAEQAGRP
jgi:glycosyltransferase involved in cell wall biosynthesis